MKRRVLLVGLVIILVATTIGCGRATAQEPPSSIEIFNILKEAGVPVGEFIDHTEATDPNNLMNRPNQYIAKLDFEIIGVDQLHGPNGGSIEIFRTARDARDRKDHIDRIGAAMPLFMETSEIFLDVVLIRIDSRVTHSDAQMFLDLIRERLE